MSSGEEISSARYRLFTAAHHLLITLLPLREPESADALSIFVQAVERIDIPPSELDAVLLRCLAVINRRVGCLPTLIERYLSELPASPNSVAQFRKCVEERICYRDIRSGPVQDAIELIEALYGQASCTPRFIADRVGSRLPTLDVLFKSATGCTLTEHIRSVRLIRGAVLLTTTNKSIKEVWVDVGYRHHSNFDHDFKRRFHLSPSEYRARTLRPAARAVYGFARTARGAKPVRHTTEIPTTVLYIDDDDTSRTVIAHYLCQEGFSSVKAVAARDGLGEAERLSPNVILVGDGFPESRGLELIQSLRRQSWGGAPTIVLFTADCDLRNPGKRLHHLDVVATSKLCDLEQIRDLIVDLSRSKPLKLATDPTVGGTDRGFQVADR